MGTLHGPGVKFAAPAAALGSRARSRSSDSSPLAVGGPLLRSRGRWLRSVQVHAPGPPQARDGDRGLAGYLRPQRPISLPVHSGSPTRALVAGVASWSAVQALDAAGAAPARSCSWITRGRSRTSSIRRWANTSRWSCSWRCWEGPTTRTPRRRRASRSGLEREPRAGLRAPGKPEAVIQDQPPSVIFTPKAISNTALRSREALYSYPGCRLQRAVQSSSR